jgi:beta-lactamase regulating signal transducer with metallopeptidase domain
MGWTFLLDAFPRWTALLLGAEALLRLSTRQSPAFRHRLLVMSFALLAALPMSCAIFPAILIPAWGPAQTERALVTVHQVSSTAVQATTSFRPDWPTLIWLTGFSVAFAPILIGLIWTFRVSCSAREFRNPAVQEAFDLLGAHGAMPPILISGDVSVPLTYGPLRPCILLPSEAICWKSSRMAAVLSHELSHVRRHDVAAQIFA